MKTKHTEGPWTIHIGNNNFGSIQAANGKLVLIFNPKGEDLANARLIASAPELLKTLEDDHYHYLSLDFENNENTPKLWHGLSEVLKWHLTEHPDCTTCKIINKAKGEL